MSRPSVPASYKKLKGILSVTSAQVEWIPTPGQSSATPVTIPVGLIRRLQATPPTNPKVMIKVFVSQNPNQEPVASVFTFTSSRAREDCDMIQESIKLATAERSKPKTVADILKEGEEGLLKDTELQQSLLRQDSDLRQIFTDLVIPKLITADQFWRARVHLLRAHAIERTQQRGPYNVLSVLKPKTQDGTTKVSLSADRIRDVFEQHPLIKRVYDENVPKLSEDEFWSRFFMSRLKKKLSGERITDKDPVDDVMDKYLRPDYNEINKKRARQDEVPNFINLEANEEHISKKGGNQPDRTMRPNEDVPMMHTLNSLSRRMVDSVTQEPESSTHETEDYMAQLRLADLEPERPDDHVSLHIRNPEGVDFGQSSSTSTTKQTIDPAEALKIVRQTMQQQEIDLLTVGQDSSSLSSAAKHITSEIKSHALSSSTEDSTANLGLSKSALSQLELVHSTAVEFLRQFWLTYLSTTIKSSVKRKDLETLTKSLQNTLDRLDAVKRFAATEGGEEMGIRAAEVLKSINTSVNKAISLGNSGR